MRRTEEAEAHFTIFVHLLAVWRETSWPGRSPHHPPPRAIKPPTRSKQPRDLRSTLDLQKENIASRMEGTTAVAHSPLLTTPINHLNSGSACCPTHAKDGGRSAVRGWMEGRLFLDHFARTADHGGVGWEGRRDCGGHPLHSKPTIIHVRMGERRGRSRGRREERTPKCMRGGVNFHFHPLTACCLRRRSFGMAEASGKTIPILASAQLPSHSVGRNAQGRRERTGTITNASNLDTNPM